VDKEAAVGPGGEDLGPVAPVVVAPEPEGPWEVEALQAVARVEQEKWSPGLLRPPAKSPGI
jgi:hypothetical protein